MDIMAYFMIYRCSSPSAPCSYLQEGQFTPCSYLEEGQFTTCSYLEEGQFTPCSYLEEGQFTPCSYLEGGTVHPCTQDDRRKFAEALAWMVKSKFSKILNIFVLSERNHIFYKKIYEFLWKLHFLTNLQLFENIAGNPLFALNSQYMAFNSLLCA